MRSRSVGAGFGAVGRFWLASVVQAKYLGTFPFGTFIVNLTGSLLIGIVMAIVLARNLSEDWRLFVVTGLLGGYTTFSAFSYEAFTLFESRHLTEAFAYIIGSSLLSILACWLGVSAVRFVLSHAT